MCPAILTFLDPEPRWGTNGFREHYRCTRTFSERETFPRFPDNARALTLSRNPRAASPTISYSGRWNTFVSPSSPARFSTPYNTFQAVRPFSTPQWDRARHWLVANGCMNRTRSSHTAPSWCVRAWIKVRSGVRKFALVALPGLTAEGILLGTTTKCVYTKLGKATWGQGCRSWINIRETDLLVSPDQFFQATVRCSIFL